MKRSSLQKTLIDNHDHNVSNKKHKTTSLSEEEENDVHSDASDIVPDTGILSFTDTEAALRYVRNILTSKNDEKKVDCSAFPPIVFVHQLYDIINNKTVVNRQIEILRNEKKIIIIHLGNEKCMKIVVFFEDLKKFVLEKCDASQKFLVQKFFDKVLMTIVDIGISRANLIANFRFSEKDIRLLVNIGLLILKDTGIFWFSFPSAGVLMKKLLKGRMLLLKSIKKRKYREVLEFELKKLSVCKSLELPKAYHIHDLVGGGFVNSIQTSSGRLLRIKTSE